MDTSQWPQDTGMKPTAEESTLTNYSSSKPASIEKKVKPQKDQAKNCPRCNSINTKFCYYNNYSLSQPRFFCKTCRRYWTEGGSLRNIPVGGGSRKNKRSTKRLPENLLPPQILQNPNKIQESQDLNLGFSSSAPHDFKTINELIQVPNFEINTNYNKELQNNPSSSSSTSSRHYSTVELLIGRGDSSFMPMPVTDPNAVYSSGFSLPEFKSSLNFSLDVLGSNYGSFQGVQGANGKLLFPYEDLNKQVSTNATADAEQNRSDQIGDSTTGYWNGMISGGSW